MGSALSRKKTEENYSFMSWYVDCANCGKEVLIDGPEDRCYFCGKNASKIEGAEPLQEEVVMAEKQEKAVAPIPLKPRNRRKVWAYYLKNKEAMIVDHNSMRVSSFFQRWHISSVTWGKLRELWEVPNKEKHSMYKRPATSRKEYKEPRPGPGEFSILITEADLAKLDDEQFRQLWLVLGKIIQNRKS